MKLRNILKLSSLAILPILGIAQGCVGEDTTKTATPSNVTEVNHAFRGKWAVDMNKVDAEYGRSSAYFLGVTAEEAGLPNPQLPPVWDQTAKREADGSLHVETGTEYAVIDRDGNKIDPTGYVNIIPMFKDTDPSKQEHITNIMNDGDVIVYVHPEQTGARGAMERRASHVGMHYEYKAADGRELVHHIDNPNSYGPVYNHRPSRQMPFHVYRFKPKAGDLIGAAAPSGAVATPDGVAYSGSQRDAVLAIVNSDDSGLLETLDVDLALRADAARNIVAYRENNGNIESLEVLASIPRVGPSAMKALRDGSGASESQGGVPMTAAQAKAYGHNARNWALMNNDISPFASFFDLKLQKLDDLASFRDATLAGEQLPGVYCSGLAYVNINLAINFPLNADGLGSQYGDFESGSWRFSDSGETLTADQLKDSAGLTGLNRLVFEPYGPTGILNAWIKNYWGSIPLQMQQQIFQTPEFQQGVIQGFRQLEWSDDQQDEKQSSGEFTPATVENVTRWANAYGRTAEDTDAFLAADAELAGAFNDLGLSSAGMTPMDIVMAVEDATIENKFVPPQIWMDEADKDDSSLVYVGTVLNCEILTAVDGSGDDPCAGGGGGVTEFKEGASDSSTYPDFALPNGGHVTHRRFDVAGPENFGPDSTVTVRITHGDVGDTRFLLHVPSTWEGHPGADLPYQEYRAWCREALATGGSCAANTGIVLETATSGSVDDGTYTWRLGDICEFSADGTSASCPMGTVDGGFSELGTSDISTWADGGRISVTAADLGGTSMADLPNCSACQSDGGQYNQFSVHLIQSAE